MGKIHAYLITEVEIIKPELLDIAGYPHSFWPGEVVLDKEDHGATAVTDFVDGPITFRCELAKVASGVMTGETPVFPSATQRVLQQLEAGKRARALVAEQLHVFVDKAKERLEEKVHPQTMRLAHEDACQVLDTLERELSK